MTMRESGATNSVEWSGVWGLRAIANVNSGVGLQPGAAFFIGATGTLRGQAA